MGETSKSEKFMLSHRSLQYMKVRNRWCLFVTLFNNPSLKEFRKSDKYHQKSVFSALNIMVKHNVGSYINGTVDPLSPHENERTDNKLEV